MKALAVILLAGVGCTTTEATSSRTFCTERPIGDPTSPIELTIVSRDPAGKLRSMTDARPAEVALLSGKPGIVLSVRARNLDGCAVSVSMRYLGDDRQGGAMVELDEAGDVDPTNLLNFVELSAPSANAILNVVVEDAAGRWGTARWSP